MAKKRRTVRAKRPPSKSAATPESTQEGQNPPPTSPTTELACEKLRIEIARLQEPWWKSFARNFRVADGVALIVGVSAICTALYTGYFSALNERLSIEKLRLEDERETLQAEIDDSKAQLEQTQHRLDIYEKERNSIQEILALCADDSRDISPEITLTFLDDYDTFRLVLVPSRPLDYGIHLIWSDEEAALQSDETFHHPNVPRILELASGIERIRELEVRRFILTRHDIDTILSHTQLTSLVLHGNGLTDDSLMSDGPSSNLTRLSLAKNVGVTRLPASRFTGLSTLVLNGTSFDDDGIATLAPLSATLTTASFDSTAVTDAGLAHLARFHQLNAIILTNTLVGVDGLLELGDISRLQAIIVSDDQLSNDEADQLFGSSSSSRIFRFPTGKEYDSSVFFQ